MTKTLERSNLLRRPAGMQLPGDVTVAHAVGRPLPTGLSVARGVSSRMAMDAPTTWKYAWLPVVIVLAIGLMSSGSAVAAEPADPLGVAAFRREIGLAAQPGGISTDHWAALLKSARELRTKIDALRGRRESAGEPAVASDWLADAEVHWRNVYWLLRYEETMVPEDAGRVKVALQEGLDRVSELAGGRAPWAMRKGTLLRGFVSAIDGSVQPYGVIVPLRYDPARPIRLDVVLHGSMQPRGGVALRFCHRFVSGMPSATPEAERNFIELHPMGRVENGYRWAGEADIFEAIEAVCRNYSIDRGRVVLRGFSMGASGTWHVGLKHPDRFAALGPYCGYVDTYRFSASPNPRFVKVTDLPRHQALGLRLNDAVDYAANARLVPVVAAMGELDPGAVNHAYMAEAFAAEGLEMVNLIAPGTAHTIHPPTLAKQLGQISAHLKARPASAPKSVRFITWTLKYSRCHWIEVQRLTKHYERTEIAAAVRPDGVIEVTAVGNVERFAIDVAKLGLRPQGISIMGHQVNLPVGTGASATLVLDQGATGWRCALPADLPPERGKRPGLQGPIDDAFTGPFLCVKGTGVPWNPRVEAWASATLRRFAYEWARYLGGELPVKNDTEVTAEDLQTRHLVLFGDPGSNRWIREALPNLPVRWSRDTVGFDQLVSPSAHAPKLICASPLPGAHGRYLLINSGHTFHESEFATLNYLLYPRLGDWALVEALPDAEKWMPGGPAFPERVLQAGFFGESWQHRP